MIKPVEVLRNKNGMWYHPELPHFGEKAASADVDKWLSKYGLTHHLVIMDGELGEKWGNGELESCIEWQPETEVKDAFLGGVWDTEDGVVAMFLSPANEPLKAALHELRDAIQKAEAFGLVYTANGEVITGAIEQDGRIVLVS